MSLITTHLLVAADGVLSVASPIPPGEYLISAEPVTRPVVAAPDAKGPIDWSTFPTLDLTPVDPDATFSRGEICGDDMR